MKQSEIYKKMVAGVVTIFPLIEEDVGMMLDGLLQDTAQAIVGLSECEWVLEDTILDESFYATQCGIHPSFGPGEPRDLEESGYKYCHYCGGEVKEIT